MNNIEELNKMVQDIKNEINVINSWETYNEIVTEVILDSKIHKDLQVIVAKLIIFGDDNYNERGYIMEAIKTIIEGYVGEKIDFKE